ncbi:hypothetical protein ACSDQ9_06955 [Aestuariimicrobium soli]|uniref:hypothetical protein n=1 Tax=Aestuariimicrobium soli TaxID=2035834 RepID=UPI003EC134EB
MSTIVDVRRDPRGVALANVTVLLDHAPAPHEAITEAVLRVSLTLDLVCRLDRLAWVRFTLASPDGDAATVESRGPFGQAALQASVAGEQARRLLTGLAAGRTTPQSDDPVVRVEARRDDGLAGQWRVNLLELLSPVVAERPDDVLHLITVDGDQVPRPRSARASRDAMAMPLMRLTAQAVAPLTQVVAPTPLATLTPINGTISGLRLDPGLVVMFPVTPAETGPVLSGEPLLADKGDDTRWYLPEVTLVAPAAGVDAEDSPFTFDLRTAGHQSDGTTGLEATVTLTLAAGPSEATLAAWHAAGDPTLKPVPCAVQVGLSLPFRDELGATRAEVVAASETVVNGTFGESGSTVTVRFVLADTWARLAYGSLSTPGFQESPAQLVVTLAHAGWRPEATGPHVRVEGLKLQRYPILATRPQVALRKLDQPDRTLASTHLASLAKAKLRIQPALQDLHAVDEVAVARHTWVQSTVALQVPAMLPCADHGQLYRQLGTAPGDGWRAIGCQPALRLGETEYRTWQREPATSVTGVQLFRSLTQPGRYLVLAENHQIGRRRLLDPDDPLAPTLLLSTVLDVDNPANIRCVLAAALEPPLTAADRARIAAELGVRAGRPVDLVDPWRAGLTPEISWAVPSTMAVECMPIDTGFTVLLTTDVPGVQTLRTLLTRSGLVGSARYRLPGGDDVASTLRLDLTRVVGPPEGPVEMTRTADRLTLVNRATRRVSVAAVLAAGTVVASPGLVLDPGATATVDLPSGTPTTTTGGDLTLDWQSEPGTESLDEDRSYIDDLNLGVTFIATGDLTQVAGLEVSCELLGHRPEVLVLTARQRQGERQFVLPLTSYAADPVLTWTATAVQADGTRIAAPPVAWPVRTQGVLIAVPTPV